MYLTAQTASRHLKGKSRKNKKFVYQKYSLNEKKAEKIMLFTCNPLQVSQMMLMAFLQNKDIPFGSRAIAKNTGREYGPEVPATDSLYIFELKPELFVWMLTGKAIIHVISITVRHRPFMQDRKMYVVSLEFISNPYRDIPAGTQLTFDYTRAYFCSA